MDAINIKKYENKIQMCVTCGQTYDLFELRLGDSIVLICKGGLVELNDAVKKILK